MRLEVLGLERGQEQRGAAEVCLTEVLADRDRRSEAFDALAGLGGSLSAGRWWMSRQRVFTWLRDNGFPRCGIPVSMPMYASSGRAVTGTWMLTWHWP